MQKSDLKTGMLINNNSLYGLGTVIKDSLYGNWFESAEGEDPFFKNYPMIKEENYDLFFKDYILYDGNVMVSLSLFNEDLQALNGDGSLSPENNIVSILVNNKIGERCLWWSREEEQE